MEDFQNAVAKIQTFLDKDEGIVCLFLPSNEKFYIFIKDLKTFNRDSYSFQVYGVNVTDFTRANFDAAKFKEYLDRQQTDTYNFSVGINFIIIKNTTTRLGKSPGGLL